MLAMGLLPAGSTCGLSGPPAPDPDAVPLWVSGSLASAPLPIDIPIPTIQERDWPTDPDQRLVLEITIAETGNVEKVHPLRGVKFPDKSPIPAAIYEWKFSPSILNGNPIEMRIIVAFQLSQELGLCAWTREPPLFENETQSDPRKGMKCAPQIHQQ